MYLQKVGNKQNKLEKKLFLYASGKLLGKRAGSGAWSINQEYGSKDPDPDPYQNFTDPEHCYLCTVYLRLTINETQNIKAQ